MNPALLQVEGIRKYYDGAAALKNVDFSVRAGEVHALMGENGAGKSTLSKILAGAVTPDSGAIKIDGHPVVFRNPLAAQRLGIAMIYQELDLFPNLTVAENMVIGSLSFAEGPMVNFKKLAAFCRPFLDLVGLACDPGTTVARLSIGQIQLVAVARALSMQARVILMDEPTSALFDDSVSLLFDRIADLKSRGVAIVYISHKMDEIFRICDRVTVLRDGEMIGVREVAATARAELIRMMVGRDLHVSEKQERELSGEILLSVRHLTTTKLKDVSFEVRRGEILGVAGLVGAGRSELGAAIFGIDRPRSGTIERNGIAIDIRSPKSAMEHGISMVPEDRRLQGLMLQMSVLENSSMAALRDFSRLGLLRPPAERAAVARLHSGLAVKASSARVAVSTLSGGNQQKVRRSGRPGRAFGRHQEGDGWSLGRDVRLSSLCSTVRGYRAQNAAGPGLSPEQGL